MASALKLYGYADFFRTQKIQVAGALAGVVIEVPAFNAGVDNKSEEFKRKNPIGKLPVLDTPHGSVFESNSILRYIARIRPESGLYGSGVFSQSLVDQWLDFTQNEIEPYRSIWLYPINGSIQYNPKAYAEAKQKLADSLTALNRHLLNHTYLVGNGITIADVAAAAALAGLYKEVFAPEFIAPFGNVTRWYVTIANQPEFISVFGKVELAKTEKLAAAASKDGGKDKGGKADKKDEKKKEEPKKADKEKEDKKKKEKEPEADEDGDEEKPKPKPKGPLDLLPPSPLVLDTVKRALWSQRPIVPTFFNEGADFWTGAGEHKEAAQFDAQGWSFWVAHYKFNDENKVMYMTSNLVSGFIQRSDVARKWSFGVMNITGNPDEETPPFKVLGVWFFRGTEFLPVLKEENPDSEYYEWKKLDVTKEADRQIIRNHFNAEELEGEKVLERKYFK